MEKPNYNRIKKSFVRTNNPAMSGVYCIISILNYYSGSVKFEKLITNSGVTRFQSTLLGLSKAFRAENFIANGYKADIEYLKQSKIPLILHLQKNNGNEDFVVFYGYNNHKFTIGDPAYGIMEYSEKELDELWKSKILLLAEPDKGFINIKAQKINKLKWVTEFLKPYKKFVTGLSVFGVLFAITLLAIFYVFIKLNSSATNYYVITVTGLFLLVFIFSEIAYGLIIRGMESIKREFSGRLIEFSLNDGINRFKNNVSDLISVTHSSKKLIQKLIYSAFCPALILIMAVSFYYVSKAETVIALFLVAILVVFILLLMLNKADIKNSEMNYIRMDEIRHNAVIKASETEKRLMSTGSESVLMYLLNDVIQNSVNGFHYSILNRKLLKTGLFLFMAGTYLILLFFHDNYLLLFCFTVSFICILYFVFLLKKGIEFVSVTSFLFEKADMIPINPEKDNRNLSEIVIDHINEIKAEKVSYCFPGKIPVFEPLTFDLNKPGITMVYGTTGSGKTILSELICGLRKPTSGNIFANSNELHKLDFSDWNRLRKIVLNPSGIEDNTVFENLAVGISENEKVIDKCCELGFDKFFRQLPDDYATSARNISSGFKQLTSFANAMIAKPEFLILDDPFTNMDKEMKELCKKLLIQTKDSTYILLLTSDYDLSGIADKTILLANGNL